jgi:hypothetical protein
LNFLTPLHPPRSLDNKAHTIDGFDLNFTKHSSNKLKHDPCMIKMNTKRVQSKSKSRRRELLKAVALKRQFLGALSVLATATRQLSLSVYIPT